MKRILAALLSFALCLALLFFVRNKSDEPILHVALKSASEQDAAYVYESTCRFTSCTGGCAGGTISGIYGRYRKGD